MAKPKYKNLYIIRAKAGWRIQYEFEIPGMPGKYKKHYVRDGINYHHNLDEREKEAQRLLEDVETALKNGFSPYKAEEKMFQEVVEARAEISAKEEEEKIKPWTLEFVLERFITYCKWKNLSHNTVRTYQSFINNIHEYLTEANLLSVPARQFSDSDALKFLDEYYDEEEWTPRTYNNHVAFFTTLFSRVKKLEKKENDKSVKYDIDLSDIEQKTDRAEKNRYYSDIVAAKVKDELKKHPVLYSYSKWIFCSCMRPREIRLLQIQHIDLQSRQIKAIGPTAKTGDRFVPISDELMALILDLKLNKFPSNWYVFGGDGIPGPVPHIRDYFSMRYRPIKMKLGLDDKYTLYGWKHTRVVELLMAGFTDAEVMSLTGHEDYESFKTYKRSLVVDYTAMKGKTINF